MSFRVSMRVNNSMGGTSFTETVNQDVDALYLRKETLAVAEAGSMTGASVFTTTAATSIETGFVVDLYWSGGVRYGMTATVAGQAITLASGAGDALPAESTSLVITVADRVELDVAIAGDQVCLASFSAISAECSASFTEVDLAEDFGRTVCAGCVWKWYQGNSEVNPLAGKAITNVIVSQGSTTAGSVQVAVQYNND